MSEQVYEQLTLFPVDSHASRFPLPGSKEARKMTVTSGRKCAELLRKSDPLGCLVKMCLGSSIWRSMTFYLTWKISVTPRGRLLFQLAESMPRIEEVGSLSSQETGIERWKKNITGSDGQPKVWKTVVAVDAANREFYHNSRGEPNLSAMVKIWPTPRASSGTGAGKAPNSQGGVNLQTEVGGLLSPMWVEWLMGYPIGWTELSALETQ